MTELPLDMVRGTKPLPSVMALVRYSLRDVLKRGDAKVPCGSCTACCRTPSMEVNLGLDEEDTYEHTVPFDGRSGERFGPSRRALAKRADGSCVYLVGSQCSIYEKRPRSCRMFDCRFGAMIGWMAFPDQVFVDALKEWASPRTPTAEDRHVFIALRMAVIAAGPGASADAVMLSLSRWGTFLPQAKALDAAVRKDRRSRTYTDTWVQPPPSLSFDEIFRDALTRPLPEAIASQEWSALKDWPLPQGYEHPRQMVVAS